MKLTVDLGPNSYPIHIENRRTCKRSVLREKNHERFR